MNAEEIRQVVENAKRAGLIRMPDPKPKAEVNHEMVEMWVVYRNCLGGNPKPLACFALEAMATEFVNSETHRRLDFIKRKSIVIS
jgi:hypothetical protein